MAMIQINLLPKELRRGSGGLRVSKTAVGGLAAAVLLVAALAAITYYQKIRLGNLNSEIAQVESKTASMRSDIQMVDHLVDVKTRILKRMNAIEALDHNRGAWVQNIEDLSIVIPDFLWVSEFRQGIVNSAGKVMAPPPGSSPADSASFAKNALTLDGYCFTLASLSNFIVNLQDSPRFSNIRLKYAKLTTIKDRPVYSFEVGCQLEPVERGIKDIENRPAETGDMSDTTTAARADLNAGYKPESDGEGLQ
ncbi:MAG: PilN domain-containing protein [candidate division Zixibacteria bacterium]|nr:PilN domain-containing protein [candidate division Zixibacteria bacterium]